MTPARVRFAPSPTGRLHIGSGRSALYNYLLARQTGGQFILRLEDTDRQRFDPSGEREILDGLRWLGLDWDEGFDIGGPHAPYRQSERKDIYQQHAAKLIDLGRAYHCFCSPQRLAALREEQQKNHQPNRYDGLCLRLNAAEVHRRLDAGEPHVIRIHIPADGQTVAWDQLRGDIVFENANLDDAILVRSDGFAVYHLAAIVDDYLMGITHVFRGSEWLPSFPLHVNIYDAFGWQQPEWYHLSVFLKASGKGKMSKRDSAEMALDGNSIFVNDLAGLGYLPEAAVNWIALMGWSYDDRTEFFTLRDLIEKFDPARLNPAPAAINFSKFDHFNGVHIRTLPVKELAGRIQPFFLQAGIPADLDRLVQIAPLIQERLLTLDEAVSLAGFFFKDDLSPGIDDLIPKGLDRESAHQVAGRSLKLLENLPNLDPVEVETTLRNLAEELGLKPGQVFGVLRGAITGQQISPPLMESMAILGREVVLARLRSAVTRLAETA